MRVALSTFLLRSGEELPPPPCLRAHTASVVALAAARPTLESRCHRHWVGPCKGHPAGACVRGVRSFLATTSALCDSVAAVEVLMAQRRRVASTTSSSSEFNNTAAAAAAAMAAAAAELSTATRLRHRRGAHRKRARVSASEQQSPTPLTSPASTGASPEGSVVKESNGFVAAAATAAIAVEGDQLGGLPCPSATLAEPLNGLNGHGRRRSRARSSSPAVGVTGRATPPGEVAEAKPRRGDTSTAAAVEEVEEYEAKGLRLGSYAATTAASPLPSASMADAPRGVTRRNRQKRSAQRGSRAAVEDADVAEAADRDVTPAVSTVLGASVKAGAADASHEPSTAVPTFIPSTGAGVKLRRPKPHRGRSKRHRRSGEEADGDGATPAAATSTADSATGAVADATEENTGEVVAETSDTATPAADAGASVGLEVEEEVTSAGVTGEEDVSTERARQRCPSAGRKRRGRRLLARSPGDAAAVEQKAAAAEEAESAMKREGVRISVAAAAMSPPGEAVAATNGPAAQPSVPTVLQGQVTSQNSRGDHSASPSVPSPQPSRTHSTAAVSDSPAASAAKKGTIAMPTATADEALQASLAEANVEAAVQAIIRAGLAAAAAAVAPPKNREKGRRSLKKRAAAAAAAVAAVASVLSVPTSTAAIPSATAAATAAVPLATSFKRILDENNAASTSPLLSALTAKQKLVAKMIRRRWQLQQAGTLHDQRDGSNSGKSNGGKGVAALTRATADERIQEEAVALPSPTSSRRRRPRTRSPSCPPAATVASPITEAEQLALSALGGKQGILQKKSEGFGEADQQAATEAAMVATLPEEPKGGDVEASPTLRTAKGNAKKAGKRGRSDRKRKRSSPAADEAVLADAGEGAALKEQTAEKAEGQAGVGASLTGTPIDAVSDEKTLPSLELLALRDAEREADVAAAMAEARRLVSLPEVIVDEEEGSSDGLDAPAEQPSTPETAADPPPRCLASLAARQQQAAAGAKGSGGSGAAVQKGGSSGNGGVAGAAGGGSGGKRATSKDTLFFPDYRERVVQIFEQLAQINHALGERFKAQSYGRTVERFKRGDVVFQLLPPNLLPLPEDDPAKKTLLEASFGGDAAARRRRAEEVAANRLKRNTILSPDSVIPGVGFKIREKLIEILSTGGLSELHQQEAKPLIRALRELTQVHGVGPRTAIDFYKKFGIRTVEQLRDYAIKAGELDMQNKDSGKPAGLVACADKSKFHLNDAQRLGLVYCEDMSFRIPHAEGRLHEAFMKLRLRKYLGPDYDLVICGSYRRQVESAGDIDVLITQKRRSGSGGSGSASTRVLPPSEVLNTFLSGLKADKYIEATLAQGPTKFMGLCRLQSATPAATAAASTSRGTPSKGRGRSSTAAAAVAAAAPQEKYRARRLDVRYVDADSFPAAMLYFTGSKNFNVIMRSEAIKRNCILNEYGLFRKMSRRQLQLCDVVQRHPEVTLHDMISRLSKFDAVLDAAKPVEGGSAVGGEAAGASTTSSSGNPSEAKAAAPLQKVTPAAKKLKKKGKERSAQEVAELREMAKIVARQRVKAYTEHDIFNALGMDYVSPKDRNV